MQSKQYEIKYANLIAKIFQKDLISCKVSTLIWGVCVYVTII